MRTLVWFFEHLFDFFDMYRTSITQVSDTRIHLFLVHLIHSFLEQKDNWLHPLYSKRDTSSKRIWLTNLSSDFIWALILKKSTSLMVKDSSSCSIYVASTNLESSVSLIFSKWGVSGVTITKLKQVCKLIKYLYDLKQANIKWYDIYQLPTWGGYYIIKKKLWLKSDDSFNFNLMYLHTQSCLLSVALYFIVF